MPRWEELVVGLKYEISCSGARIWDDARDTTVCPARNAAISHNASAKNDARSADDVTRSANDVTWSENGATRNVPS